MAQMNALPMTLLVYSRSTGSNNINITLRYYLFCLLPYLTLMLCFVHNMVESWKLEVDVVKWEEEYDLWNSDNKLSQSEYFDLCQGLIH